MAASQIQSAAFIGSPDAGGFAGQSRFITALTVARGSMSLGRFTQGSVIF